ncbi:MAG: ABC transporter permease [Deltaproteobacteria bacterium]|nr:ABC transporter permease [Deltaproteobacteria bacterium]
MLSYLARRTLTLIPLLFGITLVSFLVIHLAPGSPIDVLADLNPKMTAEAKQRLITYYGLDKPLHERYWQWLRRFLALDFGVSFSADRRAVMDKIKEALPITITINVLSLLLIFLVAVPIGAYSASHLYSTFDKVLTVFVYIGFAIPTFWLALLTLILFSVQLEWLPISGLSSLDYPQLSLAGKMWDLVSHLILPVLLSAFSGLAGLSRYMRGSMLEVMRQEYITAARSKGLSEAEVIYKHALRNALLPVVTILGLSVPGLIGGSVIFEQIFGIPGMGRLFFTGVMSRDYPLVMGILTIGAFLTLLGNLLADVSYAIVDPRIRRGGAG